MLHLQQRFIKKISVHFLLIVLMCCYVMCQQSCIHFQYIQYLFIYTYSPSHWLPSCVVSYNTQWCITSSVIQHYGWLTCLRLACSVCLLVNGLSLLSLTTSAAFALPAPDFVNKTVENHRWIETVSSAQNKKWRRLPDSVPSNTQGWRILPNGTHFFFGESCFTSCCV